jgi:hypothetical protein
MRLNTLSRLRQIPRRIATATTPTIQRKHGFYPWYSNGGDIHIRLAGLKNQDFELILLEAEAKKLAEFINNMPK